MAKSRAIFPAWVQTLGAMSDEGAEVYASCSGACRGHVEIDPAALIDKVGRSYSLVNRRSRCKAEGCKGWWRVFYKLGVFRPLWDEATDERWGNDWAVGDS
jgi:hypothetical protein